ncbi:hypothetical protein ACA910_008145 [Epithemia clementina (nom. ined.)]
MGGFNMEKGRAWRLELDPQVYAMAFEKSDLDPDPFLGSKDVRVSNNLFAFIASVMTIWQAWSALGWMHRASFGTDQPLNRRVAQKLVELALKFNFALHPEHHIPGKQNSVADILSRSTDLCNTSLTQHIHSCFCSQIPANFDIFPLQPEIKSWISLVAPLPPECSMERSRQATSLRTEHAAMVRPPRTLRPPPRPLSGRLTSHPTSSHHCSGLPPTIAQRRMESWATLRTSSSEHYREGR